MKKLLFVISLFLPTILSAQNWVTPVIDGYGKIKYSKNVAVQPDKDLEYKIVYKITTGETREGINKGLNGIAHAINMLGCANISNDAVKIVATIQGPATAIILTDTAYEEKFGKKKSKYRSHKTFIQLWGRIICLFSGNSLQENREFSNKQGYYRSSLWFKCAFKLSIKRIRLNAIETIGSFS
jgi:hypothetical protein